ncbi:MAG TPA: STAS/SEC14 domain-containing protein, partial [Nocardioidaceae bacterium]
MIRLLGDMPAGVLGLEAVDDVEKEDYENVIVPAVKQAVAEHGKVRVVYVLGPEFDEYEREAVWEDLKLGVSNPA